MVALKTEHHCFIQSLMNSGPLKESDARVLYQNITRENSDQLFDAFWSRINGKIDYISLQIKRVRYPEDEQVYMGVINTLGDESSKLATTYTAEQIALFRGVVEGIMADEASVDQGLDSIQALNLNLSVPTADPTQPESSSQAAQPLALTKPQREQALKTMCDDKWLFHEAGTGYYKLGVRSFLELGSYLKQLAPESVQQRWDQIL